MEELQTAEQGIVNDSRTRRGDPIVIGRILNPRTSRSDVSFFIAWVARLDRV